MLHADFDFSGVKMSKAWMHEQHTGGMSSNSVIFAVSGLLGDAMPDKQYKQLQVGLTVYEFCPFTKDHR